MQVITWGLWAQAAIVPGLVSLLTIPLLTFALMRPTLKDSAAAQAEARLQLRALGKISRDEALVLVAMGVTVALWVGGHAIGVSSVAAALAGLSILLVTDVISWGECLRNTHAWDTVNPSTQKLNPETLAAMLLQACYITSRMCTCMCSHLGV